VTSYFIAQVKFVVFCDTANESLTHDLTFMSPISRPFDARG